MSSGAGTGKRDSQAGSWSLVTRLTIHHTALTLIVLAVSSGLLYWGLISSLAKRNSAYLASIIHSYSTLIKTEPDQSVLQKEIVFDHVASEYITSYARILDAEGRIIMETPRMSKILPPGRFPPPEPLEGSSPDLRRWTSPAGSLYTMKAVVMTPEYARDERRILQVALEVSRAERIRREYREKLLMVLFFGTFVSCLGGMVVARRGLEPLEDVVRTAERVDVTNLAERIPSERFPRELQVLARSFDKMLDRLKDSFDSLSHYANQLAHEIRTPVAVMMGEAEIALSRTRTAEEYREVIASGLEELERLSRLIDNLLFIVRSRKGEISWFPEELDACAETAEMLDYYGALAEHRSVSIKCEGESRVTADRYLFRRAIGNVLANAIYFTPSSGEISVRLSVTGAGTEITVTDTGCGIPEHELSKVFDNFYRVKETAHLHPKGTGLGLPIVRAIMELHGGSVTIAANDPTGTRATLSFPKSRP